MLRTLPLLLAGLMVSSTALAEAPREPTEVRVSLQGVDFANPAAVAQLYQRLRTAAHDACQSTVATPAVWALDRACSAKALDRAVQAVNQPTLLALYNGERTLAVASNHPDL